MQISVKVDERKLRIAIENMTKEIKDRATNAVKRSNSEVRNYLVNKLLSGKMLTETVEKDVSSSSLEPGELKDSVRVRSLPVKGGYTMSIYLEGRDQLKFVATKLMEGVSHSWDINAGSRQGSPTGKKMLRFKLTRGNLAGYTILKKSVTHPGLKARPFLQQALSTKRNKVLQIFREELGTR